MEALRLKSGAADGAIRASTATVVLAVAGIAAYISYWHAYAVVRAYGESGATALLEPATIDGLVYASSMVILYAARHRLPVPRLARWMLALGVAASLAVNVAQGWSHGLVGAVVAAWPAVALVGSYELLAWMIRTAAEGRPDREPVADEGGPHADQAGTSPWHAEALARATGFVAASRDGASPASAGVHGPLPVNRAAAQEGGQDADGPDRAAGEAWDAEDHAYRVDRAGSCPEPANVVSPVSEIDAAAVAAYRASVQGGRPLSERELAEAFGRTSRRWARNRMAEAWQSPASA